jgi:predicted ferric reductase
MRSTPKKVLFYSLFFLNLLIIFTFWRHSSASLLALNAGSAFIALGRLFGLLAVYAILLQVLFIGRVRWLESVFGLDKLSIVHSWNGYVVFGLMIIHPIFLTIGYSLLSHTGLVAQSLAFLSGYKFVLLSLIALILFIIMVVSSIIIVKKKLRYETWYYIHLIVYAAILLAFFHQIAVGGDFAQASFRAYWRILYLFVLINLLVYRFIRPVYNYVMHRFVVEEVMKETDSAVSIYIAGKSMKHFRVLPGQFIIVRFLSREFWPQAHPFSISGITRNHIRITIKSLGDYTKEIATLKKDTHVLIDGPHGIFTTANARRKKFLFIAAGVGITPIKAMLEECKKNDWDAVLLYANRKKNDMIFYDEIVHLVRVSESIKAYAVLSDPEPGWKGEHGRVDEDKLRRLVTDIKQREVYLCGPAPMMESMVLLLRYLGVDDKSVHYEKFSL